MIPIIFAQKDRLLALGAMLLVGDGLHGLFEVFEADCILGPTNTFSLNSVAEDALEKLGEQGTENPRSISCPPFETKPGRSASRGDAVSMTAMCSPLLRHQLQLGQ